MKKIYKREIIRIGTNFFNRNRSTLYFRNKESVIFKIVCHLLKNNWIECSEITERYVSVRPSKKLAEFLKGKLDYCKPKLIQECKCNRKPYTQTESAYCISPEIAIL